MTDNRDLAARVGVVLAAAVIVLLAGLLGARLLAAPGASASAAPAAPAASVPAPRPCDLSQLELPCWGCLWAEKWPLQFRTDLDMLAPLGTGPGNAATWFAAFRKPDGPRLAEANAALARRVHHAPLLPMAPEGTDVLPPDDPLLAEAAPWCDQATMRFYPDLLPLRGLRTPIPNLLLALTFARSWIARGSDAPNFDDAMADFRRVIRLGRLLRQEDTILISDLIGLPCIRWGAEAIYDRARKEGRTDLALLAAVVAGEGAPQRWLTAARVTAIELGPYARRAADGTRTLDLPEARFEALKDAATKSPDRRFRLEAAINLHFVALLGPEPMRAKAKELLVELSRSEDPIVAANARWGLDTPLDDEQLKQVFD